MYVYMKMQNRPTHCRYDFRTFPHNSCLPEQFSIIEFYRMNGTQKAYHRIENNRTKRNGIHKYQNKNTFQSPLNVRNYLKLG